MEIELKIKKDKDYRPVLDDENVYPICPHCEKKIDKVKFFDGKNGLSFGITSFRVFACPHCMKVLGTGYAKMM